MYIYIYTCVCVCVCTLCYELPPQQGVENRFHSVHLLDDQCFSKSNGQFKGRHEVTILRRTFTHDYITILVIYIYTHTYTHTHIYIERTNFPLGINKSVYYIYIYISIYRGVLPVG